MTMLRWVGRNLGTLLLSLVLAIIVWVTAVIAADPNQQRVYDVPIEILGQSPDMEIVGTIPDRLELTLYAPRSNLTRIDTSNGLSAWIDLSSLQPGQHSLPIQYQLPEDVRPVRVEDYDPEQVEFTLEALITDTITIETDIKGTPALGYQADEPQWSVTSTVISGRSSLVERVSQIRVELDISGANETIEQSFQLIPRDADGNVVSNVTLNPNRISVVQPITLRGGYRNLVVKVVTTGQVAVGYRQTNITVSPPTVLVFSADPALIDQLPGFIETQELDLTDAVDDIETILPLNLPEGVSVIGDPNVLVMVGVAALEDSITLSKDVEAIGLLPGLEAMVSPESVSLILAGPIPDLDGLTNVDVRVVVDLTGLEVGTYQLTPKVEILPDRIRLQAITPLTVEVTIAELPTPTVTPTPAVTPTPNTSP